MVRKKAKGKKVKLYRVMPGPHRETFASSMSAMGLRPLTTMEGLPKGAEYWWTQRGWDYYAARALSFVEFNGFPAPEIRTIEIDPKYIWETDGVQAILIPR